MLSHFLPFLGTFPKSIYFNKIEGTEENRIFSHKWEKKSIKRVSWLSLRFFFVIFFGNVESNLLIQFYLVWEKSSQAKKKLNDKTTKLLLMHDLIIWGTRSHCVYSNKIWHDVRPNIHILLYCNNIWNTWEDLTKNVREGGGMKKYHTHKNLLHFKQLYFITRPKYLHSMTNGTKRRIKC